jgi:hypothetical protein
MLNELKTMYEKYDEKAREVRRKAPVFAGALGLGSDPRKHPCHEEFYENVGKWIQTFVESKPDADAAKDVALFLLQTPPEYRQVDSYWFMYVCVGMIRDLIPLLRKEDCAELAVVMDKLYAKKERMPVQMDTLKKLQKAGK